MSKPILLIVEDDPEQAKFIAEIFEEDIFQPEVRSTANEAIGAIEEHKNHIVLIILDIDLGKGREGVGLGYSVLAVANKSNPQIPVIITTGRPSAQNDKVLSYHSGAVIGFYEKPIDYFELEHQIRNYGRLSGVQTLISIGDGFAFQSLSGTILKNDKFVYRLGDIAAEILGFLLSKREEFVDTTDILNHIYKSTNEDRSLIHTAVGRLRAVLKKNEVPVLIEAINRGRAGGGYCLKISK